MAACAMPPANAITVDAGACTLVIDVTATFEVPPVPPSDETWTVDGEGTCTTAVDDDIDTMVGGDLDAIAGLTAGCAVGAFDGVITLTLDDPAYEEPIQLEVVVVVAGAVVELVGRQETTVVATGTFVQDTANTTECLVGQGTQQVTWCGVLVFADPEL